MKKFYVLLISFFLLTSCGEAPAVETPPVSLEENNAGAQEPNTGAEEEPPTGAENAEELSAADDPTSDTNATDDDKIKLYGGYVFSNNGTPVYLGDEMVNILDALGPETDYYEAPSCAFDGTAKIYVYSGFEMATYITGEDGPDRLYSITFFDDSVTTAEGVYIGQSYGDMVAAYGEDYEEIPGSCLYSKDGAVLSFTVEDDLITVIQYYIEDIYG